MRTLFITNCPTELQKKHGFGYAPNQPWAGVVLAASVTDINRGKQQAVWKKMSLTSLPSLLHSALRLLALGSLTPAQPTKEAAAIRFTRSQRISAYLALMPLPAI